MVDNKVSSSPLSLLDALTKGLIVELRLKNTQTFQIEKGDRCLILSGVFHHITGTDSELQAVDSSSIIKWNNTCASANGSDSYPFFNTDSAPSAAAWSPHIFQDNIHFIFYGAAAATLDLQLLIWRERK